MHRLSESISVFSESLDSSYIGRHESQSKTPISRSGSKRTRFRSLSESDEPIFTETPLSNFSKKFNFAQNGAFRCSKVKLTTTQIFNGDFSDFLVSTVQKPIKRVTCSASSTSLAHKLYIYLTQNSVHDILQNTSAIGIMNQQRFCNSFLSGSSRFLDSVSVHTCGSLIRNGRRLYCCPTSKSLNNTLCPMVSFCFRMHNPSDKSQQLSSNRKLLSVISTVAALLDLFLSDECYLYYHVDSHSNKTSDRVHLFGLRDFQETGVPFYSVDRFLHQVVDEGNSQLNTAILPSPQRVTIRVRDKKGDIAIIHTTPVLNEPFVDIAKYLEK